MRKSHFFLLSRSIFSCPSLFFYLGLFVLPTIFSSYSFRIAVKKFRVKKKKKKKNRNWTSINCR